MIAKATPWPARTFLAATPLLLAACRGPLSTLDPAGPAASSIAALWWVMLAGSFALFSLVIGLFVLVLRRPGFGSRLTPGRWIVLGGLAMPGVVLTALVAYALYAGERLLAHGPAVTVQAEGRMWEWRFSYPDLPQAGETLVLHIPAGTPVDVRVTSLDVIHSFWVPRLAGKIDAVPGHENVIRIEADRPGTYHGICAEFCGTGHTDMRFSIVAHAAEADFEAAVSAIDDEGEGQE